MLASAASALLLIALPAQAQSGRTLDFGRLEAHFAAACASSDFSGVVAVVQHGKPAFQHVCGDADPANGVANTLDTRFKIFSTSKYLTAIAVLRSSELGVMTLDAPISTYVQNTPTSWSGVTVRNLLNHTSGLPDLTEEMLKRFDKDHPSAMRATLASLSAQELDPLQAAGADYRYNNFGFELLAEAAANAWNKPFDATMKDLVFDPAGMTTDSVEKPNMVARHPVAVQEDGLAIGFNGAPGKLQQAENWAFVQLGAGAVRASLADMIALDRALAEHRLLTPESLSEMRRSPVVSREGQAVVGERGYGLGVVISQAAGLTLVGHSGGTNGYIADFEQAPDHDAALIILTNRGFTALAPIRKLFGELFTGGQIATGS